MMKKLDKISTVTLFTVTLFDVMVKNTVSQNQPVFFQKPLTLDFLLNLGFPTTSVYQCKFMLTSDQNSNSTDHMK